jgi:hypothetical protein
LDFQEEFGANEFLDKKRQKHAAGFFRDSFRGKQATKRGCHGINYM